MSCCCSRSPTNWELDTASGRLTLCGATGIMMSFGIAKRPITFGFWKRQRRDMRSANLP